MMKQTSSILHRLLLFATGFLLVCASPGFAHADPCKEKSQQKACISAKDPYATREFTLNGPGVLNVFTVAGNIDVKSIGHSSKVRVELYVDKGYAFWSNTKNLDNYRITMMKRGNEVFASVERKTEETGFFSDQITFSFKIYVPRTVSSELKTSGGNVTLRGVKGRHMIKSNAGNINIDGVEGKLGAYTSGGNIEIANGYGTLFAQTKGGNITIDHSEGELRVKTDGGRIIAERISGSMLAKVEAGDIKAQFVKVGQGISLQTSAGNIWLELPRKCGYDLVLRGSNVRLYNGFNFEGTKTSTNVEGTLNKGGPPINLTTESGNISLKIDR